MTSGVEPDVQQVNINLKRLSDCGSLSGQLRVHVYLSKCDHTCVINSGGLCSIKV